MDDYWKRKHDYFEPYVQPLVPFPVQPSAVPREEFDALKREVEELKKLLIAAKQYDDATGQPDCEQADKMALIRKLAELVGVDLSGLTSLESA
jgi:hypothetical protein